MEIMGAVGQKQYSSRRMNQSKVGDACHPLALDQRENTRGLLVRRLRAYLCFSEYHF